MAMRPQLESRLFCLERPLYSPVGWGSLSAIYNNTMKPWDVAWFASDHTASKLEATVFITSHSLLLPQNKGYSLGIMARGPEEARKGENKRQGGPNCSWRKQMELANQTPKNGVGLWTGPWRMAGVFRKMFWRKDAPEIMFWRCKL